MTNEEAIEELKYSYNENITDNEAIDMAIKALEQEPCEDAISRQAALNIFDENPTYTIFCATAERLIKALPSVTPQEPCEDAISRQAAIDALSHMCSEDEKRITVSRANVNSMLRVLPSVNPQRTGHWIKDDITERSKIAYKHKCDRCGAYHRAMYDYCPSCGARMVEPQESEGER